MVSEYIKKFRNMVAVNQFRKNKIIKCDCSQIISKYSERHLCGPMIRERKLSNVKGARGAVLAFDMKAC
jgi:hypothetical protein